MFCTSCVTQMNINNESIKNSFQDFSTFSIASNTIIILIFLSISFLSFSVLIMVMIFSKKILNLSATWFMTLVFLFLIGIILSLIASILRLVDINKANNALNVIQTIYKENVQILKNLEENYHIAYSTIQDNYIINLDSILPDVNMRNLINNSFSQYSLLGDTSKVLVEDMSFFESYKQQTIDILDSINRFQFIYLRDNLNTFQINYSKYISNINSFINKLISIFDNLSNIITTEFSDNLIDSKMTTIEQTFQNMIAYFQTNLESSTLIIKDIVDHLGQLYSNTYFLINNSSIFDLIEYININSVLVGDYYPILVKEVQKIIPSINVSSVDEITMFLKKNIDVLINIGFQVVNSNNLILRSQDIFDYTYNWNKQFHLEGNFLNSVMDSLECDSLNSLQILLNSMILTLINLGQLDPVLNSLIKDKFTILKINYDNSMEKLNIILGYLSSYFNNINSPFEQSINVMYNDFLLVENYLTSISMNLNFQSLKNYSIQFFNLLINNQFMYDISEDTNKNKDNILDFINSIDANIFLQQMSIIDNSLLTDISFENFLEKLKQALNYQSIVIYNTGLENKNVIFPSYFQNSTILTLPGNPIKINNGLMERSINNVIDYLSLIEFNYLEFYKFNNKYNQFFNNLNAIIIDYSINWQTAINSILNFNTKINNKTFNILLSLSNKDNILDLMRRQLHDFSINGFISSAFVYPILNTNSPLLLENETSISVTDYTQVYKLNNLLQYPKMNVIEDQNILNSLFGSLKYNSLHYMCFSTWYRDTVISKWFIDNGFAFPLSLINNIISDIPNDIDIVNI